MTAFAPIGRIDSPFERPGDVDHDLVDETEGTIVVDEKYAAGLDGLEGFSHIVILAHLDQIDDYHLRARPPHVEAVEVGVFATRSPHRPNPIAQTVVELLERDGNRLHVRGLDLVDGTPVLDIKPYVPTVSEDEGLALGWLDER
ncbi:tRNA (N6-threonylcarbamoyladenosine(37)-N6)-methyltransferase TrmO [Halobellus sp. Atlit-38R]|uniref:tRNA (N6-threonylcarbamoyladenosine(37)-N6)-methyltransferase TrmO n=1 Tax=Halobellus sp. Atlit-38R TaxID=2282131 RepID=UPI000EF26B56|nr:tRNA (N6-threonylcarbamoyladenosine(37)-N6)-methyltransferase TrmO [Halobellus sp. Atlit-38R]RLM94799.1 tRNA (N6-threonylcarbamoyladenosine(37)-N6)-methyltransferase TrmO [Halobellus sp. Atlit-38R]